MIMSDDKKRIATIMSSRKSAKGENLGMAPMKAEVVKDEDGEIDGKHVAAKDIISALHEKSPDKLMRALVNFCDMYMAMKEDLSNEE